MLLGDGDGFVRCACGQWHWGLYGAAGLLVFDPDRGVLLQHRAWWTHHGGTWGLPGGAVRSDETAERAAVREAVEEADVAPESLRSIASTTDEHGTWRYTTVLARAEGALNARAVSAESAELRWVAASEVDALSLHGGFAAAWPALRTQLGRELVLIVDELELADARCAAQVGLRDCLRNSGGQPLVAESAGLPGPPGWTWWPTVTVMAPGAITADSVRAGDSADYVVVVTSDRELRQRLADDGVDTVGPRAVVAALGNVRGQNADTAGERGDVGGERGDVGGES